MIETLIHSEIDFSIYFYNPNIHPVREYELRKRENIEFAEKHGIPFMDADYDMENWFARVKGLEHEPERGLRCTSCFEMRFERTALFASENSFDIISSSLGISRWKDFQQVTAAGERAASRYPHLCYWSQNWRKLGGASRMIEISKRENFYQQEYCGYAYSLRGTNLHRIESGTAPTKLGTQFYGQDGSKPE